MFPIRQDIEILPANSPPATAANQHLRIDSEGKVSKRYRPLKLVWTVKEVIGQAIVNARGIAKGSKKIIIGE
jgi:hypothetical protein